MHFSSVSLRVKKRNFSWNFFIFVKTDFFSVLAAQLQFFYTPKYIDLPSTAKLSTKDLGNLQNQLLGLTNYENVKKWNKFKFDFLILILFRISNSRWKKIYGSGLRRRFYSQSKRKMMLISNSKIQKVSKFWRWKFFLFLWKYFIFLFVPIVFLLWLASVNISENLDFA